MGKLEYAEPRVCPDCGAVLREDEEHDHALFCRSCGWSFGSSEAHHRDHDDHDHAHEGHAEDVHDRHDHAHAGHDHGEHGLSLTGEGWWRSPQALTTGAAGLLALMGIVLQLSHVSQAVTVPVYLASMILGGYWVALEAWEALVEGRLGINGLITIAAIGAIILGEFFEAAVLVFLFAVGEALEDYSLDRTRRSVRQLLELAPPEATVVTDNGNVVRPVEAVSPGESILVRPGAKIPLDGQVVEGTSEVNQAPITGESVPVSKHPGETVFAGTINERGALVVRVTRPYTETTLAKIVHLVEQAQASRAASQNFIDRFSKYYTPAVVGLAVLLWTIPPLAFGQPFVPWFYRGLVALLLGCPCALVISTPVSIVSGISSAARNGGLVKGGIHLERIGSIRVVAFDKTGTLTVGRPEVTDIVPAGGVSSSELLRIAATAEARSEHHLATAISRAAAEQGVALYPVDSFVALSGQGVRVLIDGVEYFVGSPVFFANDLGLHPKKDSVFGAQVDELSSTGATIVYVGTEKSLLGAFAVADRVRNEAREAIRQLRQQGVTRIAMLTGDNRNTANVVASRLGIDEVYAELLPQDKVKVVQELSRRFGRVAMVGDGINDGPALAAADVSIAMGVAGTDTALETADIALMADDLSGLPFMVRLSRQTMTKVSQNIWFAIGTKVLAALLILPGWLTLWMAVLADVGATVVVSMNGMRLLAVNRSANKS